MSYSVDSEQSPFLKNDDSFKFSPNSRQIFRICLNLKLLIDKVIPITFDKKDVVDDNSSILNERVVELVYKAAGGKGDGKKGTSSYKYRASLVFCLLKVCEWYRQQATHELTGSVLYSLREIATQHLAALVIKNATDDEYLILGMFCHRYTIMLTGKETEPISALELAVDMHSTIVLSSKGYQRCIKWLWRGWVGQSPENPHAYTMFKGVASNSIRAHFDPSRIKAPLYQNALEIFFSLLYLALFTVILNSHPEKITNLSIWEITFQLFTIASICDECTKLYHIGSNYVCFWNAFNDLMYSIILVSILFRFLSINSPELQRAKYEEISFRILSCASPLMWSRLLLYLDAQKFVGAMLVVLKTMMKESIIFFVLLFVVIVGFLQGFLGLDASDGKNEATKSILISLVKSVVGGSDFDVVAKLVPPYASVLYYIYSFLLTVILMNILVALYSSAYAAIIDNANDEYFALLAQKTLRYIRAPDEDLYVPPLNLIEWLIYPLSFFLSAESFKLLNYYVMLIIYSPMLVYITIYEMADARRIQYNRFKGLPDDANEVDTEWDLTDGFANELSTYWDNNQIQEEDSEIREVLADQREGEMQDPEFMMDVVQFRKDVEKAVQPVDDAYKSGVKWDHYPLYSKIENLTSLVEAIVEENKLLRDELKYKSI